MEKRYAAKLILTIVFMVGIFIVVWFGYIIFLQKQRVAFINSYSQAYKTLSHGETGTAISQLQPLLIQAQEKGTQSDVVRVELVLANALFERNNGTDRTEAAAILKKVGNDNRVGPLMQAEALLYLAGWLDRMDGNESAMKELVFNNSPYSIYLSEANGDATQATISLFQLANKKHPSAAAYYQIAKLETFILRKQSQNLRSVKQIELATKANESVVLGDALLPQVINVIVPDDNPIFLPYLYFTRSVVLSSIQPYLNSVSTTTVALSFENTILAAEQASTSLSAAQYGLTARLGYAIWLYGQDRSLQSGKEKALLESVSESKVPAFDAYISNIWTRPQTDRFRGEILQISKTSPDFEKYLKRLGWKL